MLVTLLLGGEGGDKNLSLDERRIIDNMPFGANPV